MKRIKLYCNTGFANAKHTEVIEVENDTTDEELEEIARDWMFNFIDFGFYELTKDEK